MMSRPARGGRIEIRSERVKALALSGPAPHGAGGLKCLRLLIWMSRLGPAPHGAGGLKFVPNV